VSVETITRAIQFILAPAVMITSCAILVSGVLAHYAELNDRLRALARERLDLLHGPDGSLGLAAIAHDAFKMERLGEIDAQLPSLLHRHSLVHRSVLAIYLAILIFVLSMLVIAVAVVPNAQGSVTMAILALAIFLVGTVALLAGVLLISIEIRTSNATVRFEVERVMGLGK
jgi:Protein of unknown function (DUF2721)